MPRRGRGDSWQLGPGGGFDCHHPPKKKTHQLPLVSEISAGPKNGEHVPHCFSTSPVLWILREHFVQQGLLLFLFHAFRRLSVFVFFKSFFMSCTVLCNMSIPLCNEYCCYQVKNELNTHRVPTASTANLYSSEAKPSSEDSTESDTSGCVNFLVPPLCSQWFSPSIITVSCSAVGEAEERNHITQQGTRKVSDSAGSSSGGFCRDRWGIPYLLCSIV